MDRLPSWEEFMVPVLTVLADRQTRTLREMRLEVADRVALTPEQRAVALSSGQPQADNRIGWAVSYLTRVEALTRPGRGQYAITDFGLGFLRDHPEQITERDLRSVARPNDKWWVPKPSLSVTREPASAEVVTALDPTEQVEEGIGRILDEVASELLSRLLAHDPTFFETAVVRLLLAMGYGGVGGQGVTTARGNDGGIDGVIDQDVLGLNKVYVQAKRYAANNPVQRPEVQGFLGALAGKADRGIFITTSRFSPGAVEWVKAVPAQIILIDGPRLAELMVKYRVGAQVRQTYDVVAIDEDFFT